MAICLPVKFSLSKVQYLPQLILTLFDIGHMRRFGA